MNVLLALLSIPALASTPPPSCQMLTGTFIYDRAVKVADSVTYFGPRLVTGPKNVAYLANESTGSAAEACMALGHDTGTYGTLSNPKAGADLVYFDNTGRVKSIRACPASEYCGLVIETLTCQ
jgi:hypothetical protein